MKFHLVEICFASLLLYELFWNLKVEIHLTQLQFKLWEEKQLASNEHS